MVEILSEEEKIETIRKFQEEMQRFSDFLKNTYFKS